MTYWIRFNYEQDTSVFGTMDGDSVDEYEGNIFENGFYRYKIEFILN